MAIEAVTQEQDHTQAVETEQPQPQQPAAAEEADADTLALAAAEAELAAEEEAAKAAAAATGEETGEQPEEGTAGEGEAKEEAAAEQPEEPARGAPMIPKARLDQEAGKRRTAEEEVAYWRGQAEAFRALAGAKGTAAEGNAPEAQPKSPAERIAELRGKELELAKAYDDGELTAAEWTQKRAAIDDQIAEIRTQDAIHVATRQATAPQTSEWLAQETARIEAQFPVLAHVSVRELQPLGEIAKAEMERDGTPFDPTSRASIAELRLRTAELAEHNFAHRLPAGGPAPAKTTETPAAAAGPAATTRPTPEQRARKIALAESLPPDLTRAGTAADAQGLSESRLLEMGSSDFENMSEAELQALQRRLNI